MARRSSSSGSVFICHLLCAIVPCLSVDGIAAFLKPHRVPILPHVCPHLTPFSEVRWGLGHVFKTVFFVVLNSINLIKYREKTSK